MAKATFEKGQRVYVRAIGGYARIERIVPHWVKGVDAPFKIFYDLGLGRDFAASELVAETPSSKSRSDQEEWRVRRAGGGVLQPDQEHRTLPVVVTQEDDWGGWKVDPAEYDHDPGRIEHQAQVIAAAPRLLRAAKALIAFADAHPEQAADPALAEAVEAARLGVRASYGVADIEEPEARVPARRF